MSFASLLGQRDRRSPARSSSRSALERDQAVERSIRPIDVRERRLDPRPASSTAIATSGRSSESVSSRSVLQVVLDPEALDAAHQDRCAATPARRDGEDRVGEEAAVGRVALAEVDRELQRRRAFTASLPIRDPEPRAATTPSDQADRDVGDAERRPRRPRRAAGSRTSRWRTSCRSRAGRSPRAERVARRARRRRATPRTRRRAG